ncbi:ROK family transcriptional regulator [Glycomyces harbinensis]|uniref:Sugar kinase of the NBD/HSP70 family, may contain an N-terminal HTH domain n=1 Tax=Glycomyces harbinensis TaxID=58114 RepID=A0A1G6W184_9ACTN|nr:ROK family transcriptional regulator [Glycomyces harbinensis]SDD59601.1 Sugar kinase of the NBD/HSP70 family, may contain an N-terminal HTH domain [Glycomyces harbinensis]
MTSFTALPGEESEPWPALGGVERQALRELLIHGPKSRAEIARELGMSRASLTRVTRTLVDHGFVAEGASQLRGTTGRPSELLHVRPGARSFLGVKLTGEDLFAVVTDLTAKVLASHDEPLRSKAVDDVVAQIGEVHDRLRAAHPDIAAAGICLAGDVTDADGHQIIVESLFLGWYRVHLADLVRERIGVPVATENDVRSLTAAEHWFGVGAGFDSMALLTVGAGVGLGLVADGKVVTGAHGKSARVDHQLVDSNGPMCGHGHRGCVSVYLPNGSIVASLRTPGLDYPGAVALARGRDHAAMAAFGDAGRALGTLVAMVANTMDPEKIVITGDGIAVTEIARTEMESAIEAHRHPTGGPVTLDIQPFEFVEWARAGAVLAIRSCLQF